MSWRSENLLKKLTRVEYALVPEGSFLDRLRSLSDKDRASYKSYKQTLSRFNKKYTGEQAYIEMLSCIAGEPSNYPDMPYGLKQKLHPVNHELSDEELYHQLLEETRFT